MSYDTIREAFTDEHRSVERALTAHREAAVGGACSKIAEEAGALARALRAHIDVDQVWVYPNIERVTNDEAMLRALAVLRKRDREIPGYAEEIVVAAKESDIEETLAAIALLDRIMADHHRTEETEIFPLFASDILLEQVPLRAARALSEAHE